MATSFSVIIREVAKHLNAYASGNASTVQTNYNIATPTITQVVDPYFNLNFIQDKIVDAYSRLALEIANVRAHPWRVFVGPTQTAGLASSATLPTTAGGSTIVGALGDVVTSSILMAQASPQRVQQYLNNAALYTLNPYLYYISGNKIYHTASLANIEVCTYERSATVGLVTAIPPGTIALPDILTDAMVAGAVAGCIVESKGMEQASYFKNLFEAAIASIRTGQTTMPRMTLAATP